MPASRNYQFHSERSGTALTVRVLPGSKLTQISELRSDGCVIVQLACDSSGESCHPALLEYLAQVFSVDPARMEVIISGSADYKIISIVGLDAAKADALLKKAVKKKSVR